MIQETMTQEEALQARKEVEARIIAKAWKDEAYKQELLNNPKAIFEQEFGVELPSQMTVHVQEQDFNNFHFVLPMRPPADGELSDEQLEAVAGGSTTVCYLIIGYLLAQ